MISWPQLGKAKLDDVHPHRYGTNAAEVTDLGKAVFGSDLKARWPTALGTVRFPLQEMCKEGSATLFAVKSHNAALSLPTDDVYIVDARPGFISA